MPISTDSLVSTSLTASSLVGSDASKKLVTITALPNGTTATTQAAGDSTTKVATTAFVGTAVTGSTIFNKVSDYFIDPVTNYSIIDLGIGNATRGARLNCAGVHLGLVQDATFYAIYDTSTKADFGFGTLTPSTITGGAAISGGYLDLAHADLRALTYYAYSQAMMTQQLTAKFILKPNFTGFPANDMYYFSIYTSSSTDVNYINLYHKAGNGAFAIIIYDSGGSTINAAPFGYWSPTSGTDYEIEINVDITSGVLRCFIDGVQFGSTLTGKTGTRTSSATRFRIGTDRTLTATSDFSIKNFIFYRSVQHTTDYTPAYTLSTTYSYINNAGSQLVDGINIVGSSSTTAKLHIGNYIYTLSDAATLAVTTSYAGEAILFSLLNYTSSVNRPTSLTFNGKNSSNVEYQQAKFAANNTVSTASSETSEFITSVMNAGTLTEVHRIDDHLNFCLGTTDSTVGKLTIVMPTTDVATNYRCLSLYGGRTGYSQIVATGADLGMYLATTGNSGTNYSLFLSSNSVNTCAVYDNGVVTFPGVYDDTVGGTNIDLYMDNTGKIGKVSSSIRYKENVIDLSDTSWLYNLRPVQFNYKNDASQKPKFGLIAEEVLLINPNIVIYEQERQPDVNVYNENGEITQSTGVYVDKLDENGNKIPESVQYSQFIAPIIMEIKNLNSRLLAVEETLNNS